MKQRFNSTALLLLLLFLIFSSELSARFLESTQGPEHAKQGEIRTQAASLEVVEDGDVNKLRRVENCGKGDEEYIERRILIDAHLDYIFTQHHRP